MIVTRMKRLIAHAIFDLIIPRKTLRYTCLAFSWEQIEAKSTWVFRISSLFRTGYCVPCPDGNQYRIAERINN